MGGKGIIISGEFGNLCAREKHNETFELGELLIADSPSGNKTLLQVFDLFYGSQLPQHHLEMISGLQLDDEVDTALINERSRHYVLAKLKNMLTISKSSARSAKTLPRFFSQVRSVKAEDVSFLSIKKDSSLFLGNLRSGSKTLDVPVFIDGNKAFSHHVLIAGTTGRGKSVLMSNLLWNVADMDTCGMLVLDPHDEYYGRGSFGLKNHPKKDKIVYYSLNPPVGERTLKINCESISPYDLISIFDWSDAQRDALRAYYHKFGRNWIAEIIKETVIEHSKFNEATLAVIKRRLLSILSLEYDGTNLVGKGVFDPVLGKNTVHDVQKDLETAKVVIINTSEFSGRVEVLLGSILAAEALKKYRKLSPNELREKPVISIVLEEAPRVLGKEVLEKGQNVFSTIAREGRKFKIGITAITQLPSLIPREILANMNTKIILGIELKNERNAIIESAAQDLSEDSRMIASLDIGEAIITSNFLRFATPIKIPLFSEKAEKIQKKRYLGDFS